MASPPSTEQSLSTLLDRQQCVQLTVLIAKATERMRGALTASFDTGPTV